MDIALNIILGISASIIASVVFWLATFRISRTKVEFADTIEKSRNTGEYPGEYRYRIKLINTGARDLNEVTFLVKISIKRTNYKNYTYLGLGNGSLLPVMRGKKYQKEHAGTSFASKLTLHLNEAAMNEFKKNFYVADIKKKAEQGTLSLDDVLEKYADKVRIIIYAYGNDALTGARKMFTSPEYTAENIKVGEYAVAQKLDKNHKVGEYAVAQKLDKNHSYKHYLADTMAFIPDKDKC